MREIIFPDPSLADKDGLLAFGGDLEPDTLVSAYSSGIFPWSVKPVSWWSPDPRAIFEIETFRLSRRLARLYRNGNLVFTFDKSFKEVMQGCARPAPGREKTWISKEFIAAYCRLHKVGIAHSTEAWADGKLVGGVYGVAIGGFFAGESMFHTLSNASTLSLFHLIDHLKKQGYRLFDSQVISSHTASLGAIEIPRKEYLHRLERALKIPCTFSGK